MTELAEFVSLFEVGNTGRSGSRTESRFYSDSGEHDHKDAMAYRIVEIACQVFVFIEQHRSKIHYKIVIEVAQFDQESNPFKQLIISFNQGIREVMKPMTISN